MNYFSEIESGIQSLFAATSVGFRQDSSVGQNHVANWLGELQNSNDPALRPVALELENLSRAIGSNDPVAMSKSFFLLGHLTSTAALNLHGFAGIGDKLRELSQKLIAAGGNMQIIAKHQGNDTVLAH
ncbi:hypothetical protein GO988_18755 [Hymenobacter sp. HMF4947]|uniref:Uncharacterized protein n=1 Tax=Hymenobacter ginkgonis TaxID=2682976 RepID=A0A7K1TJ65_9BACT|nr:hypothetical protein [Hymenobacter ginkgonis]MVN78376.1 hypothetical protein [Hymenobacter ginkgonis]